MTDRVSATQARAHFGEIMRHVVETGEPTIVERGGRAHVVVLSIDAYEQLIKAQQQENWQDLVDRARAQIRPDLAGRELPSPGEVLRQIREQRDARLADLR